MEAKHQNKVLEGSSHGLKGKTLNDASSKYSQWEDRPELLNQVS
jgi:hypothetical protein